MPSTKTDLKSFDDKLSNRDIELDPSGYFIITVDIKSKEIIVEHYSNDINEQGMATDPETGQILSCNGSKHRSPKQVYSAITAKQMGIKLTEGEPPHALSRLDHALYLGRELQKAEFCLQNNITYIQD